MSVNDRTGLLGLADLVRGVKHEIRERRLAKGWTQDDMAERMGCSQSTYAAWELDDRRGDTMLSTVYRAAHVLGMDVEVLLKPREE